MKCDQRIVSLLLQSHVLHRHADTIAVTVTGGAEASVHWFCVEPNFIFFSVVWFPTPHKEQEIGKRKPVCSSFKRRYR